MGQGRNKVASGLAASSGCDSDEVPPRGGDGPCLGLDGRRTVVSRSLNLDSRYRRYKRSRRKLHIQPLQVNVFVHSRIRHAVFRWPCQPDLAHHL